MNYTAASQTLPHPAADRGAPTEEVPFAIWRTKAGNSLLRDCHRHIKQVMKQAGTAPHFRQLPANAIESTVGLSLRLLNRGLSPDEAMTGLLALRPVAQQYCEIFNTPTLLLRHDGLIFKIAQYDARFQHCLAALKDDLHAPKLVRNPGVEIPNPIRGDQEFDDTTEITLRLTLREAKAMTEAARVYSALCTGRFDVLAEMGRFNVLVQRPGEDIERQTLTVAQCAVLDRMADEAKKLLGFGWRDLLHVEHPHVAWQAKCASAVRKRLGYLISQFRPRQKRPDDD